MHRELESMFDLKGKVALITGGAVNFGFDFASVLASAHADVAITDLPMTPEEQGRAQKSAETLKERYDVDALPLHLDVTNAEQVAEAVNKAHDWKGHIDILINNAGGGSGQGPCHLFERSTDAPPATGNLGLGPLPSS